MFFKKTPPPVQPEPEMEYPTSLDEKREAFPVFIDVSALPNKILSVEREKIDTLDELTVVFCVDPKGKVDEFSFEISRKQHQELINSLKK